MKEIIDYLNQIDKYDCMIESKLEELKRYRLTAMGMSSFSGGERVQTSGSQQTMADIICKYIDLESQIEECARKRSEIISVIEMLDSQKYIVMHKRYVLKMPYYEIGISCGKTESWATTTHGRALKDVKKILEERKK